MTGLRLPKSNENEVETRRERETRPSVNAPLRYSPHVCLRCLFSRTLGVSLSVGSICGVCGLFLSLWRARVSLSCTEDEREDTRTRRGYIKAQGHQISRDSRHCVVSSADTPFSFLETLFLLKKNSDCFLDAYYFFLSLRSVYVIKEIVH